MTTINTILISIAITGIAILCFMWHIKHKRKQYLKNANTSTACKFKINNKWFDGTILDVTINENGDKSVQIAYFDYAFDKRTFAKTTFTLYHYCKLTDTKQI